MRKKLELIGLLAGVLLFVLPVLFQTRLLSLRLDSDWDIVLPLYGYAARYIREQRSIPLMFPYAGRGYPILADPLSAVLNPFFMVPLAVFGLDTGMSVVFILLPILAGICMMVLLARLEVSGWIRIWGSLLYAISGALTARFAAGHTLFFLSYPIVPLLFAGILTAPSNIRWTVVVAVVFTFMFFSGDVYGVWFGLLFFAATRAYWLCAYRSERNRMVIHSVGVLVLFLLLASLKLLPVLRDTLPRMQRLFRPVFGEGSVHAVLFPFFYMIPFRETFYDRPFFQRTLGFHFNWYEYYAFISPLPFMFLVAIRKIWDRRVVRLLVFILLASSLYLAMGYPYSPFYWLFRWVPALRVLRVPQRIALYATAPLIALCALCAAELWKEKKLRRWIVLLCIGSLLWTFVVSRNAFLVAFEKPRQEEKALVQELRRRDGSDFAVVTHVCCMQRFLTEAGIGVYNYYVPWRDKDLPPDDEMIFRLRPKYVVEKLDIDISSQAYYPLFATPIARIWKAL